MQAEIAKCVAFLTARFAPDFSDCMLSSKLNSFNNFLIPGENRREFVRNTANPDKGSAKTVLFACFCRTVLARVRIRLMPATPQLQRIAGFIKVKRQIL
ncbi:hypothetical protein [Amantichitinum ursilacus]|uniref:hypothetical protein n=1 Tax=Amantichitinum ursilacus TaxID=857265 RepID=UPI00128EF0AD|nr:hypothetical protein [Amantichitinum ursilacus]